MCSTLTRSIVQELLVVFLLALALLTTSLTILVLSEVQLEFRLGHSTCLRLLPFVLPRAMGYAISAAWLFAVCKVYGSLSASNQILALNSLGISPTRTIRPAIMLSAALVFPTIWLVDLGNSWGKDGIRRVVLQSTPDVVYHNLQLDRSFASKHLSLAVQDVHNRRMIHPTVSFSPAGGNSLDVMAEGGEVLLDARKENVCLKFVNGTAELASGAQLRFPTSWSMQIPIREVNPTPIDNNYTLAELPSAITRQRARVARLESQVASEEAQTLTQNAANDPSVVDLKKELDHERWMLFRLKCYRHRRCSQGFCCLSFMLFGVPLAMRLKSQDYAKTFFFSFLPILLFFYPLEFRFARMSTWPPYSLWLCHVLLVLAGLLLFRRVWKH